MAEFKEISNLGIEASKQYALYDQIRETTSLDSATIIKTKTERDINRPLLSLSSIALFDLEKRNIPFGEIEPPQEFFNQQNRTFTYNIIPSIGDSEKITNWIHVIDAKSQELQGTNSDKDLEEASQLKKFSELLLNLEKDFILVEKQRSRIKKG